MIFLSDLVHAWVSKCSYHTLSYQRTSSRYSSLNKRILPKSDEMTVDKNYDYIRILRGLYWYWACPLERVCREYRVDIQPAHYKSLLGLLKNSAS